MVVKCEKYCTEKIYKGGEERTNAIQSEDRGFYHATQYALY